MALSRDFYDIAKLPEMRGQPAKEKRKCIVYKAIYI